MPDMTDPTIPMPVDPDPSATILRLRTFVEYDLPALNDQIVLNVSRHGAWVQFVSPTGLDTFADGSLNGPVLKAHEVRDLRDRLTDALVAMGEDV